MKLRVAMAQINPTVGDLAGNSALILDYAGRALSAGAQIIVYPEMVVTGYPVEDLAMRISFQDASRAAVEKIALDLAAQGADDAMVIVGYLDRSLDGAPQNCVAVIHGGKIKARYIKNHLPNYGVFDEFRNFTPGDSSLVVRFHGIDCAIAICEDIWHPLTDIAARKPGLLLVPNGSPFERAKSDARLELVKDRAREVGTPLVYVNMTGGQDDLVFDGDTIVVAADGTLLARAAQFDDALALIDLNVETHTSQPDVVISEDSPTLSGEIAPVLTPRRNEHEEIYAALVVGLRDYIRKNRFTSVLVGLSGGIDSALVAAIACDALGADKVHGVAMPSKYSSDHSVEDAIALSEATGVGFRIVEIEPMVQAYLDSLKLSGIAEENLQARVRGTTLMGISNQEGHIVLATGNKSELAVGYSTLYGDAVGGYAPLKDIYKVDVWALAKWRNSVAVAQGLTPPIPERSITKEPSAELRPGQKDSDSLPEYPILDRVLAAYVDGDMGRAALIEAGFDEALVMRVISMVDKAEYKRRQYPPGPKVSARAFGKDRRLPMTSRWKELTQP